MNVIVVIGGGSIGQAIARRVGAGKHVMLADLRPENATAAANVLSDAGFVVSTVTVDVSSRASVQALVEAATAIDAVNGVIQAAGVSPSQATPETILKDDLSPRAAVRRDQGQSVRPIALSETEAANDKLVFARTDDRLYPARKPHR
jgi:NAD(P)-dependent dehydrogenase (short-subunit alcohol dehydrogenase family)